MLALAPAAIIGVTTMAPAAAVPDSGNGHGDSGIGVSITAEPQEVQPGNTVTFTVTVTNQANRPFQDVSVEAIGARDCIRRSLGPLDVNDSTSYHCAVEASKPGEYTVLVIATAKLNADHSSDLISGSDNSGYENVKGKAKVKYRVTPKQTESPSPSPSTSKSPSPSPSTSKSPSPSTSHGTPPPKLPQTGNSTPIGALVAGAFGLVAAGSALLFVARRRRISG
jgi:LPXTG-motif cell wall-anchored protein